MTDTQKRIKAYQKALPGLKERVLAVALLLVLSISMLTSATFAWITLSRAPEVTAVSTNVAANGSLEIALVKPDGTEPGESQVGDSTAKGNNIANANLTWGNLINLGDASYGLDNLQLRPAELNEASLLNSPLFGAVYDEDGRIDRLNSSFGYTKWGSLGEGLDNAFLSSEEFGVRAISSITTDSTGPQKKFEDLKETAIASNQLAKSIYITMANNDNYMGSLATMMGVFMEVKLNDTDAAVDRKDIENISEMYADFLTAYDAALQAIADLANVQAYLNLAANNPDFNYESFDPEAYYTLSNITNQTNATLSSKRISVTSLDTLKRDRATIADGYEKLLNILATEGSIYWSTSGLDEIINKLANINTCTLDGTKISDFNMNNAGAVLGILTGGGNHSAVITNGILFNFEEATGARLTTKPLTIKVNYMISASVKAIITTSATNDYFMKDIGTVDNKLNGTNFTGGTKIAQDTYGLAIDFWVRTNAQHSFLTLEGNVLTREEEVRATGKDPENNEVELYTYSITTETDEGSFTENVDVYKKEVEENGETVTKWYRADNHISVEVTGEPVPKMTTVSIVIGYEGENRIWGDNNEMSVDSTTQGSGSCYVYYADNPEDQARSLKLLDAMRVVFVDSEGRLLARAYMDTASAYSDSGRITVPLKLDTTKSVNLGMDISGNTTYAITALEQNVAKRITAIVYLDGTKLDNKDVLAASEIQGQLNIQFGSNRALNPIENESLELAERKVSASVDKTSFDFDTATEPMTTRVTVNVDGEQPSVVKAFFIRQLNSSQGSRETEMIFTNVDGSWIADYTFTAPGTYVLRTVQLDGVDYPLAANNIPTVVIQGFTVTRLEYSHTTNKHISIMTANKSETVEFILGFATNDPNKMPSAVQGRFQKEEDGSVININFRSDAQGVWRGSATFLTSGEYKLEYLVLDGKPSPIDESLYHSASVVLGMKVAVRTTSLTNFMWGDETPEVLNIEVDILDNEGNELMGLSNAKLYYARGSSEMDTDLTWNGKYYVGQLKAKESAGPGIWKFQKVTVGDNVLTYAESSPTFTITSPNPPEFVETVVDENQFNTSGNAQFSVKLREAEAASVTAVIEKYDKNGTVQGTYEVYVESGTEGVDGEQVFNFVIPKVVNGTWQEDQNAGTQDGRWRLKEIKIANVVDENGVSHGEENPLVFGSDIIGVKTTKVVATVNISVLGSDGKTAPSNIILGAADSNGNGQIAESERTDTFMTTYPDIISGYTVKFTDFEGEAISGINSVEIKYAYGNNSSGYGGYTGGNAVNSKLDFTIGFSKVTEGEFAQNGGAIGFTYAGSYTSTLTFKLGDKTESYGNKAPTVEVYSIKPTVIISAISNTVGSSVKVDPENNVDKHTTVTVPAFTSTTATVYFTCSADSAGSGSTCDPTYHNYTRPSVTLKLDKIGNATKATLDFGTSVQIYNGTTQTTGYEWTANGGCLRNIGYFKSKTASTDDKTPAGTITANTLVLTYNNMTFNVTIPTITINNPY